MIYIEHKIQQGTGCSPVTHAAGSSAFAPYSDSSGTSASGAVGLAPLLKVVVAPQSESEQGVRPALAGVPVDLKDPFEPVADMDWDAQA